jgi:hypothetical protein
MSDDNYNRAAEEGLSGQSYSGGNSIDYAGYMAGREARFQAELSRSNSQSGVGGGGGVSVPMDLKGKAVRFGIIFGMLGIPIGAFRDQSVLGAVLGFGVGMGVGVLLRLGIEVIALPFKYLVRLLPFLPAVLLGGVGGTLLGGPALGMAGAGILFALWLVRRRMTT